MTYRNVSKIAKDRARRRAIMARTFPCVCRGKGCPECGGAGNLGDRRSYAQLTDDKPAIIDLSELDTLPF